MQISENDADVLSLFDTLELYGLINEDINKYNHRNTAQGVTNNMVGNTNVPTTVHSTQQMIYTVQEILYICLDALYKHSTYTLLTPHIHHTSTLKAPYCRVQFAAYVIFKKCSPFFEIVCTQSNVLKNLSFA